MDPRKPINALSDDQKPHALKIVHRHLKAYTIACAQDLGATGASVVTTGVGLWAAELAELDPKATAVFLRAVADIYDPKKHHNQKVKAEKKRKAAIRQLLAQVDLAMNPTMGRV